MEYCILNQRIGRRRTRRLERRRKTKEGGGCLPPPPFSGDFFSPPFPPPLSQSNKVLAKVSPPPPPPPLSSFPTLSSLLSPSADQWLLSLPIRSESFSLFLSLAPSTFFPSLPLSESHSLFPPPSPPLGHSRRSCTHPRSLRFSPPPLLPSFICVFSFAYISE